MYYSQTPQSLKDTVTTSFEGDIFTRVAIASSSLSMGVDFPNVKYVIHFGPSKSLSSQLQEAGRAGYDGSEAFNIIMYLPKHIRNCERQVKHAINSGEKSCVRQALLSHFDKDIKPNHMTSIACMLHHVDMGTCAMCHCLSLTTHQLKRTFR